MARLRGREVLDALKTVIGVITVLLQAIMDVSKVDPMIYLKSFANDRKLADQVARILDESLFSYSVAWTLASWIEGPKDINILEAYRWLKDRGWIFVAEKIVVGESRHSPKARFLYIDDSREHPVIWTVEDGNKTQVITDPNARLNKRVILAIRPR